MNKADLIENISNKAGMSKEDSTNFVDTFIKEITKELKKGRRIVLVGFGTFTPVKKKERICRNPQTGQPMNVPSKVFIKFKEGLYLKNSINQ